jgi:hypothetical protein
MPLQIRRGTTAQRLAITPLNGELVYDTTTGQLFVGNGTTLGGATTTGISTEDAQDAAASLFSTGSHSGITFAYNDAAGRIDATVTVTATGPFDGDLTGSVFSDTSTLLVDGVTGRLVGPLATSGLVGNLDTAGFTINSSTGNVNIAPTGRTNFGSDTSLTNGDVYITRNSYSSTFGDGFTFAQHHATQDVTNFNFYRSRGTGAAPVTVLDGDDLADIGFLGWDGTNIVAGCAISVTVSGTPTTGNIPAKISFATNNGSSTAVRAELSSSGVWKIGSLGAFSGTTINVEDNNTITLGDVRLSQDGLSTINTNASLFLFANGTGRVEVEAVSFLGSTITSADSSTLIVTGNVIGDLQGSVFADNSTRIIDGTDGRITATSVTIDNTGYLQLPVYADDTARLAAIPTPVKGMMVFMTTGTVPTATNNAVIYNGSTWVNV